MSDLIIDTEQTTEVTPAEILARIEHLEARLEPLIDFLTELRAALENHPMARALGL